MQCVCQTPLQADNPYRNNLLIQEILVMHFFENKTMFAEIFKFTSR